MDAREYMNRKGVGVERDPDRPNTLEEKAWARARGAGDGRPKSGTPHDWEDWERYHEDLADDADTLEQKIDKEAHRKAVERERREKKAQHAPLEREAASAPARPSAVEHFTPEPAEPEKAAAPTPDVKSPASDPAKAPIEEPAGLKGAYAALAVLLPPLGIGLAGGGAKRVVIALALTLLGWLPGVIYALAWVLRR
ncbi:YqaE/Pmp3 family membrane protein [Halomonas sp. HMF6819]|uniref:YqaE/Pmp3 family membrane protein n=1 Tax=Halomonas sp. HMF6819 TaxID=3373085 RepID=UPI003793C067